MAKRLTYLQKLHRNELRQLKIARLKTKRAKGKRYKPPKEYTSRFPDWFRFV